MAGGVVDFIKGVVKSTTGFDAYGYIKAAIEDKNVEEVKNLLLQYNADELKEAFQKREDGDSLLDHALYSLNSVMIITILRSGYADIHSRHPYTGYNALAHLASSETIDFEVFLSLADKLKEEDYLALCDLRDADKVIATLLKSRAAESSFAPHKQQMLTRVLEEDEEFGPNYKAAKLLLEKDKSLFLQQHHINEMADVVSKSYDRDKGEDVLQLINVLLKNNLENIEKNELQDVSKSLIELLSNFEDIAAPLSMILRRDIVKPFISIKDYYTLFTALLLDKDNPKQSLEYASVVMAHCFWRNKLHHKENDVKLSKEQIEAFYEKAIKNRDNKDVVKSAIRAGAIDENMTFTDKSLVHFMTGMFDKETSLLNAALEQKKPKLLYELIREKNFQIPSEKGRLGKFIEEISRAPDDIFSDIYEELKKKNFINDDFSTALKISCAK